jgi:aminopeptidase N
VIGPATMVVGPFFFRFCAMMYRPCFLVLLVSTLQVAAQELPSPLSWSPLGYKIVEYNVSMTVAEPSTRAMTGLNHIIVERVAGTTDTVLMLHLRDLAIDSVQINGTAQTWQTAGSLADWTYHHRIVLGDVEDSAHIDTVDVYYSGTMTNEGGSFAWGGVSYDDGALYALGVTFAKPYVSATQHWAPVLDHPGYKPERFTLRCTVPKVFQVASVGLLDTIIDEGGERHTFVWKHHHPCATYLLTFGIGPFVPVSSMHDGVPHVAYVRARDTANAAVSLSLVPRMRRTFEQLYGSYPFEKVGYMSTTKGAMEHQTMIALNTQIVARRDTVNLVAAHELAHQWFGDLVSPQDFRYAWLTEAFATYNESAWLEELFGYPRYLIAQRQNASQYIGTVSRSEGVLPLEDFSRAAPSSNYPATIYQKGAVVVGMLRTVLGDSLFYGALRSYLANHAYGGATTTDFFAAVEAFTGMNLEKFRSEWIQQPGWAKLEVNIFPGPNPAVEIHQIQRNDQPSWPVFTTLPLNVTFTDAAGREVDTVVSFHQGPIVRIPAARLLRANAGTQAVALAEVVRTTSVLDDGSKLSLEVVPNPAREAVTISISGQGAPAADVAIVDLSGKVLSRLTWNGTPLHVETNQFAAGTYTVVVTLANSTVVTPLVIER